MTPEEKELLLKDLCTRLRSGLICKVSHKDFEGWKEEDMVLSGIIDDEGYFTNEKGSVYSCEFKPYLRPMSSVTEEEIDTLFDILHIDKEGKDDDWIKINDVMGIKFFLPTGRWVEEMDEVLQYLRKIHIDIHDFIGKGLVLEAKEGMYN